MKNKKQRKEWGGFTLIELLVVISIIGLLSSVVLASLSGARESARDSRRIQDIRQVVTAIELYRNQNGYLPGDGGSCTGNPSGDDAFAGAKLSNDSHCIVQELETVMTSVPTDPLSDQSDFYYAYDPSHLNDGGKCDNESGGFSAVVGFYTSETGIEDRETSGGVDQDFQNADYIRVICRE